MSFRERFKRGWNAFFGRDPTLNDYSYGSSFRPDRGRLSIKNSRSIVSSVYNQIAIDVMMINIKHVRLDSEGRYKEDISGPLNERFTLDANIDQTGRELIKDAVISMFDEGCVAIIPVLTDIDPMDTESYKILELRTGKIVEWFPDEVQVLVYNERMGKKQEIRIEKRLVAIIENPFYAVMNEPNSVAQRLNRLLSQIDSINTDVSSGKMDMIIQLPYTIKSAARRVQAQQRRKEIEVQLTNSKYGIAYIDGTEKVIQLNRSLENNLWEQAKDLQAQLFNQLGFAESIFNGTADEATLLNYYNRTISPILTAITEAMERKWISPTARSQGQAIRYFQDQFKLVPVSQLAELGDKFTRNEIMTSNEMRSKIGMKPVDDPKANELRNSNINQKNEDVRETITVNKEES